MPRRPRIEPLATTRAADCAALVDALAESWANTDSLSDCETLSSFVAWARRIITNFEPEAFRMADGQAAPGNAYRCRECDNLYDPDRPPQCPESRDAAPCVAEAYEV